MTSWVAAAVLSAAIAASWTASPATAVTADPAPVSVTLNRHSVSVRAGERFSFRSTLRNDTDRLLTGLIAHLNIAGLDAEVYVDPEDWSGERTQYLDPLPVGSSTTLRWNMQAVGAGQLVVYVVAVQPATSRQVMGSDLLRLDVSERRALSAGSVLSVGLSVPAVIVALMVLVSRRRRRLR